MKITYFRSDTSHSRVGEIVRIYELQEGEIGYGQGYYSQRMLKWKVVENHIFKLVVGEDMWTQQTFTIEGNRSFNKRVEIIE